MPALINNCWGPLYRCRVYMHCAMPLLLYVNIAVVHEVRHTSTSKALTGNDVWWLDTSFYVTVAWSSHTQTSQLDISERRKTIRFFFQPRIERRETRYLTHCCSGRPDRQFSLFLKTSQLYTPKVCVEAFPTAAALQIVHTCVPKSG